jgi:hypothetical protein
LAHTFPRTRRDARPSHCLNGIQVEFEGLTKEAQADGLAGVGSGKKARRL